MCLALSVRRISIVAASLVVAVSVRAAGTAHPPRELLLEVVVNGSSTGLIGDFEERGGRLYATDRELDSLGFKTGRRADTGTALPLDGLQGVTWRLDEKAQTIYVTAPMAALKPTMIAPDETTASTLPVDSGLGAVLNYDLVGTVTDGRTLGEALVDGRVFTPWGVADASLQATNAPAGDAPPLVRLDANFTHSDPDALRQYRAGDIISGGLSWTRPVRLGGLQVSTDFAERPDLVTFPVPTIAGAVAVPSSIDVLVNGVQVLSHEVPPGPFEIQQLPVVTGVGDVSVVVRNAAGQQTTETLPLSTSRMLLKPGLSDLSAEAGPIRLNYGVASDDYRVPAASATYRYGVADWLTVEGHAEGSGGGGSTLGLETEGGFMAGGGAAFSLGVLGTISADVAASRFGTRSGRLVSASYERITPLVSVTGSIQVTDGHFGDVASDYGDPFPTLEAHASLGISVPVVGSFGIAYVLVRRPALQVPLSNATPGVPITQTPYGPENLSLVQESKVSLLSASFSRPLFGGPASFYATAFHDFAQSSSYGVTAGITVPLGPRSAASAGGGVGTGTRYGTLQANESAPTIGDTGFQVMASVGRPSRQLMIGTYRAPWGLINAGIDHVSGSTAFRADIQGALAAVDGSLFAANTIYDSFAVIDTGAPDIGVLQENRPVGHTDSSGEFLVTDLRAFDTNRLAIDPNDVPMDADVGETTKLVRPQDRSGVVVSFPVHPSHGAVVRLVDAAGAPIKVGSAARLRGGTADLVVGYDGEVFVTGLQKRNDILVTPADGGHCVAHVTYAPATGTLPTIGPVRCLAAAP